MLKVAVQRAKPENGRSKAARYFAGFLVFMLSCTVISRGIYVYRMPQVTIGRAERKTITRNIEADGIVKNQAEKAVVTLEGIRVSEVLVREGEEVCAGDTLFLLDMEDLAEKREALVRELSVAEERLSEGKQSKASAESSAQTARERAQEDLNRTVTQQEGILSAAQEEYNQAEKKLSEYPSFETWYEEAQKKSAEYQSLKSAAQRQEASEEDREAFSYFELSFRAAMEEEWDAGRESLEAALKNAEEAVNNAGAAKEEAVREAERRLADASKAEPFAQSSLSEITISIDNQKRAISAYDALLAAEGAVKSNMEGAIERINFSAGDRTTDGAAVILSDTSRGVQFIASITAEERGLLSGETYGTVVLANGKKRLSNLLVEILSEQADGTYQVCVDVSGMGVSRGETGSLAIKTEGTSYDCCVPVSAVYSSGVETYYVFVLEEKETFLGTEYSVRQRSVTIAAKNDAYAGLEDAPVGADERVVLFSDRPIESGDTVRMKEE